jgi:hypothetical protein
MAEKLYVVGLRFVKTPQTVENAEKFKAIFDVLGNWSRLNLYVWLLRTDRSADEVAKALRTLLTDDDSVLVLGVDQRDRAGRVPQFIIEWLDKSPMTRPDE